MRGRSGEIVETVSRRRISVCAIQESRWKGQSARILSGKNSKYKFYWSGDDTGFGGVGLLVEEALIENVVSVVRINNRIMYLRLMIGKKIIRIFSVYAPQTGLPEATKEKFYNDLLSQTSITPDEELLLVCGDLNGHVGKNTAGFEDVHGGNGFGERNADGIRLLDYCLAANLSISNTFFSKPPAKLITYHSGNVESQIDFILIRRNQLKSVRDVKIINGEECTPQHKLLVSDIILDAGIVHQKAFPSRRRIWKLKESAISESFNTSVGDKLLNSVITDDINESWAQLKSSILESFDDTCGWSKPQQQRRETWWWNNTVDDIVKEKRRLWKVWKKGGQKEPYLEAKRRAKFEVYRAKKAASEEKFNNLNDRDKLNHIFQLARKLKNENQDIVGEKCIRDKNGNIAYDDKSKLDTWKQHYEKLLNSEFEWEEDTLPTADPVNGPALEISQDMVSSAINQMKSGKAAGPSGIVPEMLKACSDNIVPRLTHLVNLVIRDGKVPDEWNNSYIISLYKGKGDSLECGNYRGLKLLEVLQKILERILESIIREQIDIDSMQYGFMPGRGTTNAIFILRQMQEKYLGKRKDLFFAFVDLEKAFDRIPRKVLWWAMRSVGVEEWIVKTVQAMYDTPKSRVRINGKFSEEFNVNVGVHQGSVLSPLLFIIVMEALSRAFRTGCPWELLYADDLVIIAETKEMLLQKLSVWKHSIETKGLRVNTLKTKVMHCKYDNSSRQEASKFPCGVCRKGVGSNSILCSLCKHYIHKRCSGLKGRLKEDPNYVCPACISPTVQTPPLEFIVDGSNLELVPTFCYLGDMIGDSCGCFDAITARIKSAWKKFRELLPILTNKSISLKSRGRVFQSAIRGVLLHASVTWALTKEDSNRLIRNDNAMIRWICSTRVIDRIPTETLRARLGISSLEVLLRQGRLRWFGHVKRMDNENWEKKMLTHVVEGKYIGRPKKRWLDNVNDDLKQLNINAELAINRTDWRTAIKGGRRPTPAAGNRRR